MKRTSVVIEAPFRIVVETGPLPRAPEGQVLVETVMSAISPGTERRVYRGEVPAGWEVDATLAALPGTFGYPIKYGYTTVGRVQAVGPGVDPDWLNRPVFGFHPHESHYTCRPEELVVLPPDMAAEDALFVSNMESAVNLVMDGRPLLGEHVVIFGQGILGLLTTALLRRYPLAGLLALDRHPLRRKASLAAGADRALDPDEENVLSRLGKILEKYGARGSPDLIYEVSGNPGALNQAISIGGFHTRVVVGSWYGTKPSVLELGHSFHRNRIRLISSQVSTLAPEYTGRWSSKRRMQVVLESIAKIRPGRWITHRYPVENAAEAYELLDKDPAAGIQTVLTY